MVDNNAGGDGGGPVAGEPSPAPPARPRPLGPSLRRAWVGYQIALDAEMAAAGFAERRFPDGRVLRLCAESADVTISDIGRSIGISRQAASKIVGALHERGYVAVSASDSDGREKVVTLTPLARRYLSAQRVAARRIEQRVREDIGPDAFDALERLVAVMSPSPDVRMRDYVRAHHAELGPNR
jgi:DNA-binding MarR family transcriptional regulator